MKKAISLLLALAMLVSLLCVMTPETGYAASNQELAEIKARKLELAEQIEEAKSKKEAALEQKYLMDERNAVLLEEIDAVNNQISQTETRMAEAQQQEKEQYELFCRQVRQEEERGRLSYWSVLFKATSFADLLSRADFVNEVAQHDKNVIDKLQALRAELAEEKETLEDSKSELSEAQAELQEQVDAANALVQEYASTEEGLQDMYDAEAADAARMEEELKAKSAQRETSGGNSSVPSSSGYIWPSNSTRLITSPFGNRSSPGGIGSTDHQGVDIGASYGTEIVASKAGVVVQSGWYGGYGYCVTIQHGSNSGTYTRYGHMSRIAVSEGQTVSQGQVIGYCGSTGNSTGPHIHFEIHENGSLKNPLNYLDGYVAYW